MDYLLKAADQARSRFAYAEAVRYCEEAIGILERHGGATEATLPTCEMLGDLQSLLGYVDPANQAYDHALEVADTPTARQRIGNKRHRLGTTIRDGATIAYYEHGSGEPSLFLMTPTAYGISAWQPAVELLCQEFHITVVEPRGVGRSDPRPGVYSLGDHMEDARAVVEATGNWPIVFVGISRAGALAVNFATTYPHLVEKLVLIGSHPARPRASDYPVPLDPDLTQWLQQLRIRLQAEDYEQAIRLFFSRVFSEPGSHNLVEIFVHMVLQTSREILRSYFTVDDPRRELRPLLPTLHVPTLVLHGEKDRLVPLEAGRYLASHIPGAQFYVFKGRGHITMFTATIEFAQVIRNFLRTGRPT